MNTVMFFREELGATFWGQKTFPIYMPWDQSHAINPGCIRAGGEWTYIYSSPFEGWPWAIAKHWRSNGEEDKQILVANRASSLVVEWSGHILVWSGYPEANFPNSEIWVQVIRECPPGSMVEAWGGDGHGKEMNMRRVSTGDAVACMCIVPESACMRQCRSTPRWDD